MIFNMVGGAGGSGGSGEGYAAISVAYPVGSICTCSKGAVTLTATDSSGVYIFLVPEAGDWTVAAYNGDKTAAQTVNITAAGQTERVELAYALLLYDNGTENVPWGLTTRTGSGITCSKQSTYFQVVKTSSSNSPSHWIITNDQVDMSDYDVLKATIEVVAVTGGATTFLNATTNHNPGYQMQGGVANSQMPGEVGTFEISADISQIDAAYVSIGYGWWNDRTFTVRVRKIWLE